MVPECLVDSQEDLKETRKKVALMLSQGSFSTKVVILDLAKFVVYILSLKLKNASPPFIPQNKLVEGLSHYLRKVEELV